MRCLYILVFRSPQRFVGQYARTRNCRPSWAAMGPICGGCFSGGTGGIRRRWASARRRHTKYQGANNRKRFYVWWGNAAPCMKYSHLYIFYTSLKQACIKNIRLHFGLPFKILLNYNILAVLSSFGTSIAIRKTTASKIPGAT